MEENVVQSPAAEAGEWQVDVAEMMQGVTDEAEPAANPAPEPSAPESFTLRHLGETKNVGREEVIALAQKGMDYDRIRSKLGDASRELEALRSGESYDPDPAERRRRDCESFVKAFPEAAEQLRRDKGAIPAEVWDEVRRGASLTDAYAEHLRRREAAEKESELEKLRSELDRERRDRENARRSAGSAVSAGGDPPYDPIK
uniref:hypothetical protein n=1 Tax=Candidatus Scatomorpha intestinigallinarum TaxID=2840923 RepID=UPI00402A3A58